MSLDRAFTAIESLADAFVADLRRLMRQPSVTVNQAECAACAELVALMMREAGLEAWVLPAAHNPMVVGQTPQRPGRPTLLVTGHYDVGGAGAARGLGMRPIRRGASRRRHRGPGCG